MDIFKHVELLEKNISAVARVNLKRHHKYLFIAGVIGAVLYLQNSEIKGLRKYIRNVELDLQETQRAFFDNAYMPKVDEEEVDPEV